MEEEKLVLSELPFGKIILDYLKDDEVTDIQIWAVIYGIQRIKTLSL